MPSSALIVCRFFFTAVLTGVRPSLLAVLTCISFILSHVEHLSASVDHLYVFSGEMSL